MKSEFCCGMCSTSRIENMHKIFKLYLNSSNRLVELFTVFKIIEKQNIDKFHDELQKSKENDRKKVSKSDLVKQFQGVYSEYTLKRLADNLLETINYRFEKKMLISGNFSKMKFILSHF